MEVAGDRALYTTKVLSGKPLKPHLHPVSAIGPKELNTATGGELHMCTATRPWATAVESTVSAL